MSILERESNRDSKTFVGLSPSALPDKKVLKEIPEWMAEYNRIKLATASTFDYQQMEIFSKR